MPSWSGLNEADITLFIAGMAVALLLIGWMLGRRQFQVRSASLFLFLEESTLSHALAQVPPSAAGFRATLDPGPEPFVTCEVSYRTGAGRNPLAWYLQLISPPSEQLAFVAMLPLPPAAQLSWTRGLSPATALGRASSTDLWTLRQLDFVDAEYATRGQLTNGVQHVFADMQTRFAPFLTRVCVRADEQAHLVVTLHTARFDPAQVPTLVSLVRELGRAAQIR